MMKIFLVFLIFVSVAAARPSEPSPIDQRIISYTFNEEFDQAIKLSQDQIKINPDSPKYYYYYINTKILEYYQRLSRLDNDKRTEARKSMNKELIDYCENATDKFEDSRLNTENQFYYGAIYAYLARVYGMDGSWWSAFKSGLKAKNIMEDLVKADPQFYDAYLILGMLNYYADRLSGIASFAAGILGFSGDREKGLQYLKLANEKGKLTNGQTLLTLIEVYANLEDNETEAINYYEAFLKKYPRNKRITNAYVQELLNVWELKKAENIIVNDSSGLIEDYTKARYYDITGNGKLAIASAENALRDENKLWRGAGNYSRFIIVRYAWLLGDKTLLNKYEPTLADRFKESFELIKSNDRASRWLHELSVQAAQGQTVAEFEKAAVLPQDFGRNAYAFYQFNILAGNFYFRNSLYDKSESFFSKCLRSENESDKYAAAKFLTDIYLRKNVDKNKVKNLLDIIDDMDNDRLAFRAKDLEKKYNL